MNDSDEASMQDRHHEMLLRLATATKEAKNKIGDESARIEGTPVDAQSARRHHFIPQFWLRQFAEDGSLSVLSDDPQCVARSQPVKGTSVERDLYTTHAVGDHGHLGDDLDAAIPMERMLGVFENRAAPVLHLLASMADGEDVVLSDLDRYWMSALIAFQIVRTPQSLAASRRALMLLHWNGPDARHRPAKGEQYAARFASKRCELACHPSACEQIRRVAQAVRADDAAVLTLVLNESTNLGQQRTTFA